MLTIENYQRLKGTVIGTTGYYVDSIKPVVFAFSNEPSSLFYHIELTNRKQVMIVQLNRVALEGAYGIKLYEMKLGQDYINLNKYQLRNIHLITEKLNELLLTHWLP